jgi:IS5 family transposase
LTRLVTRCREAGIKVTTFHNHTRVAKRRMLAVLNAKGAPRRKAAYADLLKTTGKVIGYATRAVEAIPNARGAEGSLITLLFELRHYIALAQKVVDQTERRVMHGEKVDAQDKVVSIFEPHTDIMGL